MLQKHITSQSLPPKQLYVVNVKRVRAGKGPFAICPTQWISSYGSGVFSLYALVAGKEVIYPTSDCFLSLQEAIVATSKIAEAEYRSAQTKLNRLASKLNASKNAAKSLEQEA